jgi:hypothetical protein
MFIKILLALATIILLIIGYYLLTHTNRPLMLIHPENNGTLRKIIKFFGWSFIILGILAATAIIFNTMLYITLIMVFSCIMILVMELILITFIPKK